MPRITETSTVVYVLLKSGGIRIIGPDEAIDGIEIIATHRLQAREVAERKAIGQSDALSRTRPLDLISHRLGSLKRLRRRNENASLPALR